jgi:hypothetical protein
VRNKPKTLYQRYTKIHLNPESIKYQDESKKKQVQTSFCLKDPGLRWVYASFSIFDITSLQFISIACESVTRLFHPALQQYLTFLGAMR